MDRKFALERTFALLRIARGSGPEKVGDLSMKRHCCKKGSVDQHERSVEGLGHAWCTRLYLKMLTGLQKARISNQLIVSKIVAER